MWRYSPDVRRSQNRASCHSVMYPASLGSSHGHNPLHCLAPLCPSRSNLGCRRAVGNIHTDNKQGWSKGRGKHAPRKGNTSRLPPPLSCPHMEVGVQEKERESWQTQRVTEVCACRRRVQGALTFHRRPLMEHQHHPRNLVDGWGGGRNARRIITQTTTVACWSLSCNPPVIRLDMADRSLQTTDTWTPSPSTFGPNGPRLHPSRARLPFCSLLLCPWFLHTATTGKVTTQSADNYR